MANFSVSFDPQPLLKDVEQRLIKDFRYTLDREITAFFSERIQHTSNGPVRIAEPGLLLIREALEKKFDDPKTQEKMAEYFEKNFERIMEECMQKALQHKANAFVFAKAKEKS